METYLTSSTSIRVTGAESEGSQSFTSTRNAEDASATASPAQTRPTASGRPEHSSSSHLSGLMCNVHRTTGREPYARVGATTTILGDKLYVFGGRILSRSSPTLTNDMYELDLIRRHWTRLETSGPAPRPRYFHSVCALGDTKLVCYGGMSPAELPLGLNASSHSNGDSQSEVVVMSDIHIYDAPSRTWTFVSTTDSPQGRYAHCATILPSSSIFTSASAALSAIHHNPQSVNPNQGTLGVNIDGTGGAELVVVGGQDSQNHYIEQISVFNLRSLKWTSTSSLGKGCGAYRSVVAPIPNRICPSIGKSSARSADEDSTSTEEWGTLNSSMLIYSNYNFLDVKLELQIRSPNGTLTERPMLGSYSPPGLRFPNGGIIDNSFVVSGTYLTSSKQEYALWALDLRTLTWSRIDAGGTVFSQGSWNRGLLWNRRNTFVILGNRRRSLVEDYNHRRLNFSNVCMVELEAFGLYDNPKKLAPMSGFISASSPLVVPSLSHDMKASPPSIGGWGLSRSAEELGALAMGMKELSDMDIIAVGGERIPANSRLLTRRWGPYFIQLLKDGTASHNSDDRAILRPSQGSVFSHNPSRNSSITITPSLETQTNGLSRTSTLTDDFGNANSNLGHSSIKIDDFRSGIPSRRDNDIYGSMALGSMSLFPVDRPRTLYLPHTCLTLKALLHFLYTSSLPSTTSALSTPQILCSLLQLARPYRIDGLVEAVVERLHGVLDSRNAAAVFNAAAMAAGGGRAIIGPGVVSIIPGLENLNNDPTARSREALRINTTFARVQGDSVQVENDDPVSATSSTTSSAAMSLDNESDASRSGRGGGPRTNDQEVWTGDVSCVIGLQKRGLRGLMEGRRLRERGGSVDAVHGADSAALSGQKYGVGISREQVGV